MVKKLKRTGPHKVGGRNPSKLSALRNARRKHRDLVEESREAVNAVNRQKTVIKNHLADLLNEAGENLNNGIILDGELIAFRPNASLEIDPRTWHQWYQQKKISENQYFGALNVSVAQARKAIGEDQIEDVSFNTMTASKDLRIEPLAEPDDRSPGTIVPWEHNNVPNSVDAKKRTVTTAPKAAPVKQKAKLRRKVVI